MRSLVVPSTVLMLAFLAGCSVGGEPAGGQMAFDGGRAYRLADEQLAFGPRVPGSVAHRKTGDWIVGKLTQEGWATEEQAFTFEGTALRNLIGRAGPQGPAPILLGAHYDTRPLADRDAVSPSLPVPGANDGASGVAVLLELARVLSPDELAQPVWLVFFDAEDSGEIKGWPWTLGSTHFAERLPLELEAVIIVDMVGDAQLELYMERNSSPELAASLWAVGAELGYDSFIPSPKYALLDDHVPFLNRGIQAVDVIDFDYPYWHTTQDTLDKISPQSLMQVGETLRVWITTRR
jgi:Zn-dependent M28 family amino/carboxypeptidase